MAPPARILCALSILLVAATSPATAAPGDPDGPGAWHDEDARTTTLSWTHEAGDAAHRVYRDDVLVATLPPSRTTYTDPDPDEVTRYRVESLHPQGDVRSVEYLVLIMPDWPHAYPLPTVDGLPVPGRTIEDPHFREPIVFQLCPWVSLFWYGDPPLPRVQTHPACMPLVSVSPLDGSDRA